jgi:hypothetical protein
MDYSQTMNKHKMLKNSDVEEMVNAAQVTLLDKQLEMKQIIDE